MINWREIPFARLLLPFVAGSMLCQMFPVGHEILLSLQALLLIFIIFLGNIRGWYRYRWIYGLALSIFLLLSGGQRVVQHDIRNHQVYFTRLLYGPENLIAGTIDDKPVRKEKWITVHLAVSRAGTTSNNLKTARGRILVYISRDSASENLRYGDEIGYFGKTLPVRPPANPHAFDFRKYLLRQNIHHQAFVRHDDWVLLDRGKGNKVFAATIYWQDRLRRTLEKHLVRQDELAVGSALILGYRDGISKEIRDAYAGTGAMHVLAVSGLHVGIVFMILHFFLKYFRSNKAHWRIVKAMIGLTGIWAFALVTGASPSVVRAAVMFSFLHLGLAFYRYTSIYNTLAASAFLLLYLNPFLLNNVSFQLSYLAVLGIVYFQPKISRLWPIENNLGNYIWQLICVSLSAQLMILPLTFYYFNQFPSYFWLSSLVMVPLAGVTLCTGLLVLLMDACWLDGAAVAGKVLNALLRAGNECIYEIQTWPFAVVEGIWIEEFVMVLMYGVLICSMMAINTGKYRWVLSALALTLVITVHNAFVKLEQYRQRQWVVYSIYGHTVIDLFYGDHLITLKNDGADPRSIEFATKGHRYAMGVDASESVSLLLSDTSRHAFEHCLYRDGLLKFFNLRIAIIDSRPLWSSPEKIPVDYLIIRDSPSLDIATCFNVFEVKEAIIFDASNKHWQAGKWKKACEEMELDCVDLNQEGAFVSELNDEG